MPKSDIALEQEVDGFEFGDFSLPTKKKTEYAQLSCADLIEFEDTEFKEITGQPQPFRAYNEQDFSALVASVAEHGVIEPIIVRPWENGTYQILSVVWNVTYVPTAARRRKRGTL